MADISTHPIGRSGPRVLEDILAYVSLPSANPLHDPYFEDLDTSRPYLTPFVIVNKELAYSDPTGTRIYACLYSEERLVLYHLLLQLDRKIPPEVIPDFHLVLNPPAQWQPNNNQEFGSRTTWFQCAAHGTILSVTVSPSIVPQDFWESFSDIEILKRYTAFTGKKKTIPPSTSECYSTLSKLITRPLIDPQPATIHVDNELFNLRLGNNVMPFLGFHLEGETWNPPLVYKEIGGRLTMILHELSLRMGNRNTKVVRDELAKVFGWVNRSGNSWVADEVWMAYRDLGIVSGVSDAVVSKAYDMRCTQDPTRSSFYFEALKKVATSEELQIKVMELMSLGMVDLGEVRNAFESLGLSMDDTNIDVNELLRRDIPDETLRIVGEHMGDRTLINVLDAFKKLKVDRRICNEEIVGSAHQMQLNDGIDGVNDALLVIAKTWKSSVLLQRYEDAVEPFLEPLSLDSAYLTLSADKGDSVDTLITKFNQASERDHDQDNIITLRRALRIIGKHINSRKIDLFLNAKLGSSVDEPVGLENIGNTCYLNSLLQYYFTISPLREKVMELGVASKLPENTSQAQNLIDLELEKVEKRVGGRAVSTNEIQRSKEFVNLLGDLFKELIGTELKAISPKKELAYLALVPPSDDDNFAETSAGPAVPTMELDEEEEAVTPVSSGARESGDTDATKVEVVVTGAVNKLSSKIDMALIGRQQDVTECIGNVLFQLEAAFEPEGIDGDGEQLDLVKQLFYGKNKQVLELENGTMRREKTEWFQSLFVDVAGGKRDLYDALDSYFGEDILQLEEGGRTRRSISIAQLPPILQIQVQRVQFDRVNNRAFKSNAVLKFNETIYMDRYLETSDPEIMRKRRQVSDWRQEAAGLKDRLEKITEKKSNGLTIKDSLTSTRNWLSSQTQRKDPVVSAEPATIEFLDLHIQSLTTEITEISARLEELENLIYAQFDDLKEVGYRLYAVFIHRGQVSFGHYWVYIRDFEKNKYRKYNDQTISFVDEKEVFDYEDSEGSASPYFLVFLRSDMVDKLSTCVVRDLDAYKD